MLRTIRNHLQNAGLSLFRSTRNTLLATLYSKDLILFQSRKYMDLFSFFCGRTYKLSGKSVKVCSSISQELVFHQTRYVLIKEDSTKGRLHQHTWFIHIAFIPRYLAKSQSGLALRRILHFFLYSSLNLCSFPFSSIFPPGLVIKSKNGNCDCDFSWYLCVSVSNLRTIR
jgi:hypothetical protein